MFTKTGRDTGEIKFQTFSKGFSVEDGGRGEILGVQFEDDFLGPTLDAYKWTAATEGTSAAAAITAALNGTVQLDTGTAADKRNIIASGLNWAASRTVTFETRLRTVTSDTGIFLFAGLTDSIDKGSGKLPLKDGSLASGSIDAWADDLVGFGVRAETSDNIYCTSCIAAATPQTGDSGTDLTLSTWYVLRIELDSDGNAEFFINGTSVDTQEDAVTAADPLCGYVGAMITTGSTAAFVDIDYVHLYQSRTA